MASRSALPAFATTEMPQYFRTLSYFFFLSSSLIIASSDGCGTIPPLQMVSIISYKLIGVIESPPTVRIFRSSTREVRALRFTIARIVFPTSYLEGTSPSEFAPTHSCSDGCVLSSHHTVFLAQLHRYTPCTRPYKVCRQHSVKQKNKPRKFHEVEWQRAE